MNKEKREESILNPHAHIRTLWRHTGVPVHTLTLGAQVNLNGLAM